MREALVVAVAGLGVRALLDHRADAGRGVGLGEGQRLHRRRHAPIVRSSAADSPTSQRAARRSTGRRPGHGSGLRHHPADPSGRRQLSVGVGAGGGDEREVAGLAAQHAAPQVARGRRRRRRTGRRRRRTRRPRRARPRAGRRPSPRSRRRSGRRRARPASRRGRRRGRRGRTGRRPDGTPPAPGRRAGPGSRPSASALSSATGPPVNSTSVPVVRPSQGGSTAPTGTCEGRLSTTPSVPSSSWSSSSTTVRAKCGSESTGAATSRRPAAGSAGGTSRGCSVTPPGCPVAGLRGHEWDTSPVRTVKGPPFGLSRRILTFV